MPTFDVQFETLDRRSTFSIEWDAGDAYEIVAKLKRDGCVDIEMDDDSVEVYPLATIRKITIKEAADAAASERQ